MKPCLSDTLLDTSCTHMADFPFLLQVYDMLCESLAWRRHHNIDHIQEIWKPPEPLLNYYCGGWHNTDKGTHQNIWVESSTTIMKTWSCSTHWNVTFRTKKIVCSLVKVNCHGSCSWKVYFFVKSKETFLQLDWSEKEQWIFSFHVETSS